MEENKNFGKRKVIIILITICIGVIAFSALGMSNCLEVKNEQRYRISVIVYGTNEERWNNLKEGINQAVSDYPIDLNFVTMYEDSEAEAQELLLQREIESGTQAIAIASSDSQRMEQAIEDAKRKVPVILLEDTTNMGENTAKIGPDNGKIGEELAQAMGKELGTGSTIAIIYENMERESISQRSKELERILTQMGNKVVHWTRRAGDFSPSVFIKKSIEENSVDAVVALDDYNLENVIDAVDKDGHSVKIYGIGNTEKIVHYLDEGTVDTLVFVNEYNMGYLSMKILVENLRNNTALYNQEIKYSIVNRKDLYNKDNQRLLFPIVE
ncbi:substrate-binding domain-containing protein [Anaerosacchariphilus polymeriproducens]|uniref:Periplasmic binding protein domain-containing protein n=1 Tax=Anaerosacchariphilus polymeriproducens TaxID=1812858 RepID=A0A371AT05_9FIRM|nr:substrate-binding domain-containing protein [Anaerosacchariphilus polymeriproducens]RDU22707.1 hypothetical protein DWV06_13115 [Anaerosacchariphilus polymeriproducens]